MHHTLASDHGCISRWGRSTLFSYINDTAASVTAVCVGLSDAQFSATVKNRYLLEGHDVANNSHTSQHLNTRE